MVVLATLVMDWFVTTIDSEIATITLDLREARVCTTLGPCAVVPMTMIKGSAYPTAAAITFWAGLMFALVVLYHAGSYALSGFANDTLRKAAHGLGSLVVLAAVAAGYVVGPSVDDRVIGVERGWGPSTMLLAIVIGHLALYFTRDASADEVPYKPIDPLPVATARPKPPTVPPVVRDKPPTVPPMRAKPATVPPLALSRTSTTKMPEALRGKIEFSVTAGEITVAGIDARREDGNIVLVMWRDVVGIVARRLPPELDGVPFIDIVSTAGMTLRLLPWSKLTGEVIEGEGDDRARAIAKLVVARCKDAKVDRATQGFIDGPNSPAQLSLELLAKHDKALA